MSRSLSPSRSTHKRGAHGARGGGGGQDGGDGEGGGGGGGKLVKVAFARNQAEAEMIQGLLLQSDVPSVLKRSGGFDNPDFLAAGPHDVMVNTDLAQKARRVLAETMVDSEEEERAEIYGEASLRRGGTETSAARLALWVGVAFLAAVALVWVLYQLS
jgi:hypothetical protein